MVAVLLRAASVPTKPGLPDSRVYRRVLVVLPSDLSAASYVSYSGRKSASEDRILCDKSASKHFSLATRLNLIQGLRWGMML
jgi:hypothetical protein